MTRFNHIPVLAPAALALCLTAQSCFKAEPLNAECDIEQAYISTADPASLVFNASDTLVNVPSDASQIIFSVRLSADITALAPEFRLTHGATISPASGSVHDFSKGPVQYTVTSENMQWKRTYSVSFKPMTRTLDEKVDLTFDHCVLDESSGKYYVWTDLDAAGLPLNNWATANPAFMLARSSASPEEYPTIPAEGVDGGKGVQLVTRSTGAFGAMVNRPLAAGNIFIGTFDISKALTETLKATRFGMPFALKPLKLRGYYKYQPGETYTDSKGQTVESKSDAGTIHASFYRNHDNDSNPIVLYGDDVQSSPFITAKLKLVIDKPTTQWQQFEIDFTYLEDVDPVILGQNGYSLTVVASSSVDGDLYSGAVGSTLTIDNFQIVCELIED